MPPITLSMISRTFKSSRTSLHVSLNPSRQILGARPLSISQWYSADENKNPQRDAQQDRTKMDPSANEYAKSGTDNTAAGNEEAAFDSNTPDPQQAKEKAGEGNEVNPLDASPANPDISQPTGEEEGGVKKKISEGGGGRSGRWRRGQRESEYMKAFLENTFFWADLMNGTTTKIAVCNARDKY